MTLNTPLKSLPGVGEARSKALARLGLHTVEDLLHYYPRAYEDRSQVCSIAQAPSDHPVCIHGLVMETPVVSRPRAGLTLTRCTVADASGRAVVTFFNQEYVRRFFQPGNRLVFYGRLDGWGRYRSLTNPVMEWEDKTRFTGRIVPVYSLTAGVTNYLLCSLMLTCTEACAHMLPDLLPEDLREKYTLCTTEYAYRNIHFPAGQNDLGFAKRRLAFEELFLLSSGMQLLRLRRNTGKGPSFPRKNRRKMADFLALLPFPPTKAQRRAMREISRDMLSGRPMNRLVQGDVGSGKTVTAAFAAWMAHAGHFQAAMMAPTEILAHQHFATLSALLEPAGLRVGLLTGGQKASEKKAVYTALASGDMDFVIGTHALLSEGVAFQKLGLVITDEQHRFGVSQRAALASKAAQTPHVLVMSATPIPRTLALLVYGDLDVTIIDELPPGRKRVQTYLIDENKRTRLYGFIRRQVENGRQVYIVCPAVEESEGPPLKAVTAYTKELAERVFPEFRVAFVHGRLKPKEKETVMSAFAGGTIDILVATTVVEVGVDVPNASLMVIEDSDRFGLSQLHQLRGRVGRGVWESYCVLVSGNRSPDTQERMRYFSQVTDGFQIAEKDLELRGPGDFFGQRQHGLPTLRTASLTADTRILKEAQIAAEELLEKDPGLKQEDHLLLMERIQQLFSEDGDIFN